VEREAGGIHGSRGKRLYDPDRSDPHQGTWDLLSSTTADSGVDSPLRIHHRVRYRVKIGGQLLSDRERAADTLQIDDKDDGADGGFWGNRQHEAGVGGDQRAYFCLAEKVLERGFTTEKSGPADEDGSSLDTC